MKVPVEIKHQQQPTGKSCVSTCLAMLLDKPVQEVIDEFHADYSNGDNDEDKYLESKGLICRALWSNHRTLEEGKLYLVSIPSLNLVAYTHEIIFDWRDPTEFKVIDPNMGKEGKKYYVWKLAEDLKENEFNIVGYHFLYEVSDGE